MSVRNRLYYVHDPMCSWCWAFRPTWLKVKEALSPSIEVVNLLGGLAPDSNVPMPQPMQEQIRGYWQTIERRVPGTRFNYDFWKACSPKRSTWPACRAVIAARMQRKESEEAMVLAIQQAYYLNAQNPSEEDVLAGLAASLDLESGRFINDLKSSECQKQLAQEIQLSREMGVRGFPSLILEKEGDFVPIRVDYNSPEVILGQL